MVLVRGIATQSLYKNRQVVRHDQRDNELFQVRSVVPGHGLSELARHPGRPLHARTHLEGSLRWCHCEESAIHHTHWRQSAWISLQCSLCITYLKFSPRHHHSAFNPSLINIPTGFVAMNSGNRCSGRSTNPIHAMATTASPQVTFWQDSCCKKKLNRLSIDYVIGEGVWD